MIKKITENPGECERTSLINISLNTTEILKMGIKTLKQRYSMVSKAKVQVLMPKSTLPESHQHSCPPYNQMLQDTQEQELWLMVKRSDQEMAQMAELLDRLFKRRFIKIMLKGIMKLRPSFGDFQQQIMDTIFLIYQNEKCIRNEEFIRWA